MNETGAARTSPSLNQATYEAIKTRILTNRLRPGARLTHQQLAEDLSVSRTPVREALERLHQEGFVRHTPNRGFTVAEITRDEAFELYQMREALETFALKTVLSKGSRGFDLQLLESLNAKYFQLVEAGEMRPRMLVDRDFHLAIARASENDLLVRTLEAVFERIILKMRSDGFWTTRGKQAYSEHVALIVAIKAKDAESACKIMAHHVDEACKCVLATLESER